MTTFSSAARGITAAAFLGIGLGIASTGSSMAATEVVIIKIEPATTETCMSKVDELRSEAKNIAGTALVVAFAEEASEACKAEEYADAEEALTDGHRYLRKKQSKGGQ